MRIGLMGFEFQSPNKGCEALVYSFLSTISNILKPQDIIYNFAGTELGQVPECFKEIRFVNVFPKLKDFKFQYLRALKRCDVIFDVTMGDSFSSEFVVREYEKACQIPVDTHILRNAIDVDKFNKSISEEERKRLRKKLGLQEEDFVVLYVGRLIQVKGILELMQAVLSIHDKHVKLLCIGSANFGKWTFSSYEGKVKKLAKNNSDRIIFTGYIDNQDLYKYSLLADVQCVPSLWEEAAGLVVIEAMAEGIPTIVTNSGGMIEYIDKETSLVIERENIVENLRRAICHLKESPNVRKQMSAKSKIHSQRYDETGYYMNFVETIYKIMDENGKSRNEN